MSPRYVENIAEILLQHCDIISVISRYVPLKKAGRNHKGLCPFHNEKTPSFVVSEEKQVFHCFGCGAGGTAIQFIMMAEHMEFIEAVEVLAEQSGLDLSRYTLHTGNEAASKQLTRLQESVREAAVFYLRNLQKQPNPGHSYLVGRGLSEELIKEFGLGYAQEGWDHLLRHMTAKGFDLKLLEKAGLVVPRSGREGYYDRFRNRVMFPIQDGRGKVIGFGGRVLDDSVPKYLNSPEGPLFDKGRTLYGLHIARKHIGEAGVLILVEGYMDVVSLHQWGVRNTVATLGTAMTEHHGQLVRKTAKEAVLAYDSDSAGIKATLRGLEILAGAGVRARVVELGAYKDPDEYIRAEGPEAFRKRVDDAVPGTRFVLAQIQRKYNLESGYDQLKYLEEAAEVIKKLRNTVEQETYVQLLSQQTRKSPESIYGLFRNQADSDLGFALKEMQEMKRKPAEVSVSEMSVTAVESKLLEAAVHGRSLYQSLKSLVDPEWFVSEPARILWSALDSYYTRFDVFAFERFIDEVDIAGLSVLAGSLRDAVPLEQPEREIRVLSERLRVQYLKEMISQLEERVKIEGNRMDKDQRTVVINDLYKLKKELSELLGGRSRQDNR